MPFQSTKNTLESNYTTEVCSIAQLFAFLYLYSLFLEVLKRYISFLVVFVALLITGRGNAQFQIEAAIDYKTFYVQGHGALVDVQFQYAGYTLKHITDSTGMHATIAVQTVITDPTGKVVSEMAYALNSPTVRDSIIADFYDVQQFSLQPGSYHAAVTLLDMNSDQPPVSGALDITVPNRAGTVTFSDLLIAEHATPTTEQSHLTKSGYEIIPRLSNFYGPAVSSIPYYVEIYNSHMFGDSLVGIQQRIINDQDVEMPGFSKLLRLQAQPVTSYIRNIDISSLPTGSYRLEVAMVDKTTMQLTPTRSFYYFDRVNDIEVITDISKVILDPNFQKSIPDDSLGYYLASLLPIAKISETKLILETLKLKDKEAARKHIQQFWIATSGTKAYDSWMEYKRNVILVQELYSTNFQDGFETDRGRVYLQYGPPNQITTRENSSSEYPYEIWQYDAIKVYRNRRFVFYNPDLVNNAYRLLHSDMVGELQNRSWQQALVKRDTPNGTVDDPNINNPNRYGGNSGLYYKQF